MEGKLTPLLLMKQLLIIFQRTTEMKKAQLLELANKMDDKTTLLIFLAPTLMRVHSRKTGKLIPEALSVEGYWARQVLTIKENSSNKIVLIGSDASKLSLTDFLNKLGTIEISELNKLTPRKKG